MIEGKKVVIRKRKTKERNPYGHMQRISFAMPEKKTKKKNKPNDKNHKTKKSKLITGNQEEVMSRLILPRCIF